MLARQVGQNSLRKLISVTLTQGHVIGSLSAMFMHEKGTGREKMNNKDVAIYFYPLMSRVDFHKGCNLLK